MEIKYNLELSEDRLKRLIRGLDSSIRLLTGQISNSQNAPMVLRQALSELVEMDKELQQLDLMIDEVQKDNKLKTTA